MKPYEFLAPLYDRLTEDVDYPAFARYYESLITGGERDSRIVLDLACGTGSLTRLLGERGFQMIGVDASEEMLALAREKSGGDILYLRQALTALDLYGTADAAICSLDGFNYLTTDALLTSFRRVFLFLNPGGILAFDLNTPSKLMGQDGALYCDEGEDFLCLWRCSFCRETEACHYDFDLFLRRGDLWLRQCESHAQYAHRTEDVKQALVKAGFTDISITGDGRDKALPGGEGRIFFKAVRPEGKD